MATEVNRLNSSNSSVLPSTLPNPVTEIFKSSAQSLETELPRPLAAAPTKDILLTLIKDVAKKLEKAREQVI
jgi:hypothetical protein